MLDTKPAIPAPDSLPRLSQAELNEVMARHTMFLRGQIGGRRAIIQYHNISGLNFHNQDLSQADFTGSSLRDADLSLGIFRSTCFFACDLRDADLSHANLSRADLRGSLLSGALMSGADLRDSDMREGKILESGKKGELVQRRRNGIEGSATILHGARLSHADLSGIRARSADFSNADLSRAKTHDADFSGASFEGANLSSTDFTGSILTKADMSNSILADTVLENTERGGIVQINSMTKEDMGQVIDENEQTLDEMIAEHVLWVQTVGKQGKQLNFSGFDLREVITLRLQSLTAIRATNASFIHLDLSNAAIQSATLDHSDFRDCYMENIDLRGSSLKNCRLTRADLRGARLCPLKFEKKDGSHILQRVNLSGADLRFANLQDIDLRDAIMLGVNLSNADLSGADLRRADLSGAILHNVTFSNAQLDQAIINFNDV